MTVYEERGGSINWAARYNRDVVPHLFEIEARHQDARSYRCRGCGFRTSAQTGHELRQAVTAHLLGSMECWEPKPPMPGVGGQILEMIKDMADKGQLMFRMQWSQDQDPLYEAGVCSRPVAVRVGDVEAYIHLVIPAREMKELK